jgi:hypothetical protein
MKTTELTIVAVDPNPIASEKEEPNGTDDTDFIAAENRKRPSKVDWIIFLEWNRRLYFGIFVDCSNESRTTQLVYLAEESSAR